MITDPLHSPPTRPNVGGSDDIQIQHLPNGDVIIRKDYPNDRQRRDLKVVIVISSILCLVPVLLWLMWRNGSAPLFAVLVVAFCAICIVPGMVWQFVAKTRSYVLPADHTGLTIDITSWRGRITRHFSHGEIDDIVLDCSGGTDPHHSQFKSWLVITSSVTRNLHCLHDVGGDQLARVANALRAALHMPARTCP